VFKPQKPKQTQAAARAPEPSKNQNMNGRTHQPTQNKQPPRIGPPNPSRLINIIYRHTHLHFKNFAHKLKFLAMPTSFTGRIITTLAAVRVVVVVVIIGVVVTVPV
jgi:hypothetical protein